MSFKVNWNTLETENLSLWTKDLLTKALNSGKSPNILASQIQIKDLNFGKIAPDFEILEIGELGRDRFRGIFKINYDGDFHLTLHTKVQANPLNIYYSNSLERELNEQFITPEFLLSNEQFAIPMDLKLSDIKISGIGIIVFSKTKGLTLVFRNDPLDSIKVSSTFDTVQVLANFLQSQIENQIRDLFRDTLPTLIHQLSLNYLDLEDLSSMMNASLAASAGTGSVSSTSTATSPSDMIYLSANLRKNLQLFNSRETLKLNIPNFRNIIQRSHSEQFNKNLPNLLKSLYSNLNKNSEETVEVVGLNGPSNGIPIDLLVNENFNKTDNIIKEISSIQSNSYYKNSNDKSDKAAALPKRRTIKLNKKKRAVTPEPVEVVVESPEVNASETSTLIDEVIDDSPESPEKPVIVQPIPMRLTKEMYHELMKPYQLEAKIALDMNPNLNLTPANVTANHSTNSLLNLGLGSGYFNFPKPPVLTSPIRREIVKKNRNDSKSINYLDIEKINSKLKSIKLEQGGKRNVNVFDSPPPYYQV